MDFFESQEVARIRTKWLVASFVLAVVLIVLSVYGAVYVLFVGLEANGIETHTTLWDPFLFTWATLATLSVIGTGSLYKIAMLRDGGETVARLLGGRPVDPDTTDADERRLLNVVEEMSIASGTPVPNVFLLQREQGINAFAAGFSPDDAVIGVTDGTLRLLSRDELQGVIAHEFSHILNGDMRLNLRLIGVLHGILVIALVGYWIMRSVRFGGRGDRKGGGAAIVLLGLALWIIGYTGVFFSRLIKAAVSRQREFLADASAVQFTRLPAGIGGALKKIGGLTQGSRLESPRAEEASHLFFGNGLKASVFGLLSTHPPLDERIRRIDPSFDGTFPPVEIPAAAAVPAAAETSPPGAEPALVQPLAAADTFTAEPQAVSRQVGTVDRRVLGYAASLLAALPPELTHRAREPAGASALVYALLLDRDAEARGQQLDLLHESAELHLYRETLKLYQLVESCPDSARLPLADLCLPALRRLSPGQFQAFYRNVRRLVTADEKIDLFEYTLQRILLRHLLPHFRRARPPRVQYHSLRPLAPQCGVLLSTLAHFGHDNPQEAARAFAQARRTLTRDGLEIELLPREHCAVETLDRALEELALLAPALKRGLIEAAVSSIAHDGRVTVREAELLRAVSDSLGCPMPPLLAGQLSEPQAEQPA